MKRIFFPRLGTLWLLLVILLLLPALVFTLRMRSATRAEAESAARDSVLRTVRLAADRQQRLLESTRQILFALCRMPAFQSGDVEACSRVCADLIQQYPRYANLGIASLNGRIAASGLPVRDTVDVSGRSWFLRIAHNPDLQAGDYHLDEISGKPVVVVSHPVLESSGRLKFIAFAALDLTWLLQILDSAHLPAGSTMTLSDANGKILARSLEPGKWAGSPGPEAGILRNPSPAREATAMDLGMDGIRRLYAVSPLQGAESRTTIFVSAGIPAADVFAAADQSTARNLVILALTAALALAGIWMTGETYVARGLRSLRDAAQSIQRGQMAARTGVKTGAAELHEAAGAFDAMAAAIQVRLENGMRELAAAKEDSTRKDELAAQSRENLRKLELDLEESARKIAAFGKAEEAGRESEHRLRLLLEDLSRRIDEYEKAGEVSRENERRLAVALEEASQKAAESVKSEEVSREEVRHLKEALRATALENVQLGQKEEMLRQREDSYKQCLESSAGEIARLKVLLAESCEKLRQFERI